MDCDGSERSRSIPLPFLSFKMEDFGSLLLMLELVKVLPFIRGITEPLTRILKSYDICVTNKSIKTLQQEFPRGRVDDQCNVVYKIPCGPCPWSYIGETKRSFRTRRKEHIRNTKQCS